MNDEAKEERQAIIRDCNGHRPDQIAFSAIVLVLVVSAGIICGALAAFWQYYDAWREIQ